MLAAKKAPEKENKNEIQKVCIYRYIRHIRHTHTHIYIYIYIYKLTKLAGGESKYLLAAKKAPEKENKNKIQKVCIYRYIRHIRHTHTHTHIYIYIYIYKNLPSLLEENQNTC